MLKYRFSSAFFTKTNIFLGLILFWTLGLVCFEPEWLQSPFEMLLFGGLTAVFTFWFLDGLDYFSSLDPLPRPDSLLTLSVVVPVAAITSKYVLVLVFNLIFLRYRSILIASPFICFTTYAVQWASGMRFVKSGVKRKICFLTTEAEAEKVMRALRSKLLIKYYEPVFANDLDSLPTQDEITCVVISRSELFHFEERESVISAMLAGKQILDYREMTSRLRGHIDIDTLDLWMFLNHSVHKSTFGRIYYSSKTVFERFFSAFLLLALLPLFLVVATLSKMSSPGPIFYGQSRLGFRGTAFKLWKFRSMKKDAEKMGPQLSKMGDARITPFGNFLRKTRIDELPQLWNVVRGEMSLIGPRPERPEFYNEFEKQIPIFRFRLLVPPGITGWAQVMGGYAATPSQMKRKLEYDLFYLQKMSPKMDVIISLKTIAVALASFFRTSAK